MQRTASLVLETVEGENTRFRATTGGQSFHLDTGERAIAPSPVQVVLAAVGGCTGMDVMGILRKMRQKVTGYEIDLIAERAEEHPRVYTSIEVVHRIYGEDLNPASVERAIELSETKYCSVHAMLAPTVKLSSRYELLPPAAKD
jgi:putative redox protein